MEPATKKRFRDVEEIIDALCVYSREHPTETTEQAKKKCLIDDAKFFEPNGYVYVRSKQCFYRGGVFDTTEVIPVATYNQFIAKVADKGRIINLGEVNGKHSEVTVTWDDLDVEIYLGNENPVEFSLAVATKSISQPISSGPISLGLQQLPYDDSSEEDESPPNG